MSEYIYSEEELSSLVSHRLIPQLQERSVLLLTGPLGAGKTSLVKELLKQVGVEDIITSPTYSYVNRYSSQSYENIYHFDLYRLNSEEEFFMNGFDEMFRAQKSLVIVEWPKVIESYLQSKNVVSCELSYLIDCLEKRKIKIS